MRTPFCSPLCSSSKGLCQAFNFFENRLRPTKQGPPVVRARCKSGFIANIQAVSAVSLSNSQAMKLWRTRGVEHGREHGAGHTGIVRGVPTWGLWRG
ncbi:hypothetical protein E1A91_A09G156400v1 [Gossypium mustelinum]|uniref:Uncharacterized protein n=1 Tax=Gossypium mustelinum TaxID=34275 RepID=A0A5D2XXT5_GOSMU|nr:hypothetical protein E1A91_A09G156400v1 [Gossypium mustelinum]